MRAQRAVPQGQSRLVGTEREPRCADRRLPVPVDGVIGAVPIPRISVIMPSHDNVAYLRAAIDSALSQTRSPADIWVVDDGSTDGSLAVLASYGQLIQVLNVPGCSIGAARNQALAAMSGDYALLLDADDILLPWAVETITRAVLEHDRPTVVMSRWRSFTEAVTLPATQGEIVARNWPDFLTAVHERFPVTTATAIRADALRAVGGFYDAHFGSEDFDLWLRLGTLPGFVYLDGAPIYGYRQHSTSTTHQAQRLAPGIHFLCQRERRGAYPGGSERADDRRHLIGRNVLYGANRCWALGDYRRGYGLLASNIDFMVGHGLTGDTTRIAIAPLRKPLRRILHRDWRRSARPRNGHLPGRSAKPHRRRVHGP